MPTTIATIASNYNGALRYANGRHIDVDSSGTRWVAINDSTNIKFYYSSSPSSSWTLATGTVTRLSSTSPFSFCIDEDDGFHIAYTNQLITMHYKYGTESGGTITWSNQITAVNGYRPDTIDVAAHKVGSDYWAHCVLTNTSSGTWYRRIKVTSGTPAAQGAIDHTSVYGSYGVSVDFRHTGDGKTVQSSTPDAFIGIQADVNYVYYVKYAYSTGPTWTKGTVRTVTSTKLGIGLYGNMSIGYDGTVVMMAYWLSDNTGVQLWEIDLSDSITDRGKSADSGSYTMPTLVWDANRNVYLVGVEYSTGDPKWTSWTRSGTTWDSSWTDIEATTSSYYNVSAMRHPQTSALEVVYSRNLATDDVRWAEATTFPSVGMSGWGLIPIGG